MRFVFALMVFCAIGQVARPEVAPVPEAEQAEKALKIINAYHDSRPGISPKKLIVVYFTPADREPVPGYQQRLQAILEDIQTFYRDEMERNGFGPRTFPLERDADGNLAIHLVRGKESKAAYVRSWNRRNAVIGRECRPVLTAAGISPGRETIAIFCNLDDWDASARTFRHPSPYSGNWTQRGGLCWLTDSPILDLNGLMRTKPVIKDMQFGDVPMASATRCSSAASLMNWAMPLDCPIAGNAGMRNVLEPRSWASAISDTTTNGAAKTKARS